MIDITGLKHFLRSREAKILFLLLALGAATRIYGAWCLRHNLNLDAGVVALMAKHISEGTAFPVFFYGQAYMGSLEAYVSAIFMKIFGLYGFGVPLGTAFVSFLLLPVVYVWAGDIGGTRAGFAAVLFCIIGSWPFFYYSVQPRGGYAACILFGALSLWMSARIANKAIESGSLPGSWLFILGITAGLGWWSNQLIAAALLSSALLLVIVLGRLVYSSRLLYGVAGFFLGSLPFWVYNIQHGWPTFAFSGSFGQVSFLHGLKLFITDRLFDLFDLGKVHPAVAAAVVLLYLAAVIIGLLLMIRALRLNSRRIWISLLALYLFLPVTALIFSTSHFAVIGDERYLLPIFPCLAILLGAAVSHFAPRFPQGLVWIPVLALVALQLQTITRAWQMEAAERKLQQRIEAISIFLEEHSISAVYTHQRNRAWTFAARERIIFSEMWDNVYTPNAQYVELTDRLAVLDDYGEMTNFLNLTQGSARTDVVSDSSIHHHLAPPIRRLQEIPAESWASVHNMTGEDVIKILADTVYPHSWFSPRRPHEDFLEIAFREPVVVSGLRMLAHSRQTYPRFLQIEALPESEHEWITLLKATGTGGYFWSGNRPYPFGSHYRLEAFFDPARVERLRIVNKADIALRRDFRWGVQFLQVFGPGPEQPPEEEFLPHLLEILRKRGIVFLYSDRWPANAVYQATNGQVWTPLDASLFPESVHPLHRRVKQQFLLPIDPDQVMFFDARTALLTRWEDVPLVKRSLDHAGLHMRETIIGPWVLFDFPEGAFSANDVRVVGLRWTGFGCIPTQFQAIRRQVFPELAGDVAFFYPDNNWTTGDLVLTGLNYKTSPQDRYLRLSLKAPHPHGHDAGSLGIMVWLNRTRLALAYEEGLDFYFWMGLGFNEINSMRIQSNTFVPERLGIGNDTRMLGLMVESIELTNSLPGKNAASE